MRVARSKNTMTSAERSIDEFVRQFIRRDDMQTGMFIELENLIRKYVALERAAVWRDMERFVNAIMGTNRTARNRTSKQISNQPMQRARK